MDEFNQVRPLRIERDPDRARAEANERDVVAFGAEYPSGAIIVEWRREAFEPSERSAQVVTSRYENRADAERASGGTVVYGSG